MIHDPRRLVEQPLPRAHALIVTLQPSLVPVKTAAGVHFMQYL